MPEDSRPEITRRVFRPISARTRRSPDHCYDVIWRHINQQLHACHSWRQIFSSFYTFSYVLGIENVVFQRKWCEMEHLCNQYMKVH